MTLSPGVNLPAFMPGVFEIDIFASEGGRLQFFRDDEQMSVPAVQHAVAVATFSAGEFAYRAIQVGERVTVEALDMHQLQVFSTHAALNQLAELYTDKILVFYHDRLREDEVRDYYESNRRTTAQR